MKKLLVLIFLLVSLAVLAGLLIHLWLESDPPPSVDQAENALTSDNVFLLAHINGSRIKTLMDFIAGSDDPSPLELPGIDRGMLHEALHGEPALYSNLDQAVIAIRGTKDQQAGINTALLASGRFTVDEFGNFTSQYFKVIKHANQLYQLQATQNKHSPAVCPDDTGARKQPRKNPYLWLKVTPHWLLVSDSKDYLQDIQTRLSKGTPAAFDLRKWREYRRTRLASAGLLSPQSTTTAGGATGFIVGGAARQNPQVEQVFLGITAGYQPVGAAFNIRLNTTDSDWLQQTLSSINQQMNKLKAEAATISPVLEELASGLDVHTDTDRLDFDLNVKLETIEKIPGAISDGIASMFSMSPASNPNQPARTEQVNDNPWNFANNNLLQSLPAFKPGNFNPNIMHIDGPFALDLEKIMVNRESGLTELSIKTLLQVPEIKEQWWDSKAQLSLEINEVQSTSGKNLMRNELCLKDETTRFGKNEDIQQQPLSANQGHASLTKNIRLEKDVEFRDINRITGKLILAAPTDIQALDIEHREGSSIEHDGVRIFIRKADPQDVTYRVSGDSERVVEVRAFNNRGQVLRQGSSWSSAGNFGVSYNGDIDRLVAYIAGKQINQQFAFDLPVSSFYQYNSSNSNNRINLPEPGILRTEDWKALQQIDMSSLQRNSDKFRYYDGEKQIAVWKQSPLMLAFFHNPKSRWDNKLKFELYTPLLNSLMNNLSAFDLQIVGADNKTYKTPINITPGYTYQDDQFGKYMVDTTHAGKDYVVKQGNIDLELEKQQAIKHIEGRLLVRLPLEINATNMNLPKLGETATSSDISVSFNEMSRGMIPRMNYSITDKSGKLLQVYGITSSEQPVFPAQIDFRDNQWNIQFNLRGDLEELKLILATQVKEVSYPFNLKTGSTE